MNQAYFFSTLRGNDNNDGRSANTPWRTLRKMQEISFIPGTQILLERGSVFENEYLHLAGISGTDSDPIVVDAYGDNKNLPIIHANGHGLWYQDYEKPLDNPLHLSKGWVSSTIFLYDCAYIEVRNLSVTNQAVDTTVPYNDLHALDRTGVAVVAQNKGTLQHIYLNHLVVQNVDGNVYNKHMNNGGIYFTVFNPKDEATTGIARYHDVRIENCIVRNVSRWGIALAYTVYWDRFTTKEIPEEIAKHYGATDVVIRGNFVKDPGGDAITTMYCYRPLIEHNLSDGAGRQINKRDYCQSDFGRVAAGVWPWKCKDALFQYNEVCNTRYHNGENQDGQAFDADWGDGTIYQYNYSHDNEGGCLMICLEEAVNTFFRNNISRNDSRAILMPATSPLAKVYNNTFIVKKGVPFIATNSKTVGWMELKGNTIVGSGDADWQEDTVTYEGNLFCGYSSIPNPEQNVLIGTVSNFSAAGGNPYDNSKPL